MRSKLVLFAGAAALTLCLLNPGRNILIPIATAVIAWHPIAAIACGIGRIGVRAGAGA